MHAPYHPQYPNPATEECAYTLQTKTTVPPQMPLCALGASWVFLEGGTTGPEPNNYQSEHKEHARRVQVDPYHILWTSEQNKRSQWIQIQKYGEEHRKKTCHQPLEPNMY